MAYTKREIVGIVLWWAEGTKSRRDTRWKNAVSYPIEITNTSPAIIKIFTDFLTIDLSVPREKLRVQIQIHQGDNQNALEEYWMNIVGVQRSQLNKTIIRPVGNKVGKSNGTCKVRFADKAIYKLLEQKLANCLRNIYEQYDSVLQVYDSSK